MFSRIEEALNPYLTIGESLRRPLMRLRSLSRQEADAEVARLLESVRLSADYATRYPRQLSGGEAARCHRRAFATNPALLIGDEAVSALDVGAGIDIEPPQWVAGGTRQRDFVYLARFRCRQLPGRRHCRHVFGACRRVQFGRNVAPTAAPPVH